jgi:cell division protein FtsL
MLALFLFLAFGLLFGYFATLNTATSAVSFGAYTLEQVPMYVIVLLSLGIGVVVSSIFYIVQSFSTRLMMAKKEKELEEKERANAEYLKTIHKLELENERLKTVHGDKHDDEDSL